MRLLFKASESEQTKRVKNYNIKLFNKSNFVMNHVGNMDVPAEGKNWYCVKVQDIQPHTTEVYAKIRVVGFDGSVSEEFEIEQKIDEKVKSVTEGEFKIRKQ